MKRFFVVILCVALIVSCKTTPEKEYQDLAKLLENGNVDELKNKIDTNTVNLSGKDGSTLLHVATSQKENDAVKVLVETGANVDAKDELGRTPLLLALYNNNFEAAKFLTENGANIYSTDLSLNSPFKYSVDKGSYRYLLDENTILQKDTDGNIALHNGVKLKNRNLVDYILQFHSGLDEKNNEGLTALELAYENMDDVAVVEIANDILQGGAKPILTDYTAFETASIKHNFGMHLDDGNTPLHVAAKNGQLGVTEFLLSRNVSVDAKNLSNATALHEAVRNGHVETVLRLLNAGADINARDSFGNTPLHLVMPEAQRTELFSILLEYGSDVRAQDNYGETPLHVGSRIDIDENIAKVLVAFGSDINARNKKGETPLMIALERNHLNLAKLFVDLGANIYDEDNSGRSSFSIAIDTSLETVQTLVNVANGNERDLQGRNALHIAISKDSSLEIIEYLLQVGSEVTTRDKEGNIPLHIAVKNNRSDIGSLLLTYNSDIFATNIKGESPLSLSYTLKDGRPDWLLSDGLIESTDINGNTPLHLACEWNFPYMINFLLESGASASAKNENGETPFFSAMKGNSPQCVELLLSSSKANVNLNERDFLGNSFLHAAVAWSSYEAASKAISLIDVESLVGSRNLSGKTALQIAANQGDIRFVTLFLSYGIDINETDDLGRTALVYAVNGNKEEMVKFLLEKNSDVDQQDIYGKTALHYAVTNRNVEIIKRLRAFKANPVVKDSSLATPLSLSFNEGLAMVDAVLGNDRNIQNSDGDSPLHVAVMEKASLEIIQLLLSKNYFINKRNKDGNTALTLAMSSKQKAVCAELLQHGADAFLANTQGISPVTIALTSHQELLELLASHLKMAKDAAGDTLLHYASRLGNVETVSYLISQGFSHKAKNLEGHTPLDMAVRWENSAVEAYLRSL